MKLISFLTSISIIANAQIRVAVLDTGFDRTLTNAPLCYSNVSPDTNSLKHGTNVADLIYRNAGETGYCIIPIRVMSPEFNLSDYIDALSLLAVLNIDVLNLSISGNEFHPIEVKLIKDLLDKGVTVLAAAGNTHHNLSIKCDIYPACDDPRIIIVSNYNPESGYGKPVKLKIHEDTHCLGDKCLQGTSQSTAIETGRFIKFLLEHKF